jgi:nicotinate-nucleotide adenylyltransferase
MHARIGIFGGTFDPPHVGHLILASEAHARLQLDRLLWVLTPDPPHKQDQVITGLAHRLAMVRLAISGEPDFELSTVEMDRPGPHFALDTVKAVADLNPGAELVYLMGGDSLHDLPTWHQPSELVAALYAIGVMHRPGDAVDLHALEGVIPGISRRIHFVDAPMMEISSSEIRRRVSTDQPFRYFLPPPVFQYIRENNLYR